MRKNVTFSSSESKLRGIKALLKRKAANSSCTFRVSAIAFDKHGEVLGHVTNAHSQWDVLDKEPEGRAGTAVHAERRLFSRYGSHVKTIVICRIGKSGNVLPIDPCPACKRIADKLGAKIISVMPGKSN